MIVNVTGGVPASFPSNRVRYTYSGGATGVFVLESELANPTAETIANYPGVSLLTATPVSVNRQFFGLNTGEGNDSVTGFANPASDVNFGLVRSHDTRNVHWAAMNPSNGVYDYTTAIAWANAHKKNQGRKLIFTVYRTPAWASARPAEPSPYENGAAAEPSNMAFLSTFVSNFAQAMVNNGTPIDFWEISNEPNFSVTGKRFYSGTVAKLAEMTRVVSQAVKAIDPTTKIISPSCTNWDDSPPEVTADKAVNYFASMMAASDGAAGTMATWIDYVTYHSYGTENLLLTRINAIKTAAATAGVGAKPIIDTEVGQNATVGMTDLELYRRVGRNYIAQAAQGIFSVCYYALGGGTQYGYSIETRPVFKQRLNELIDRVTGYGITSAGVLSDGTVYANIGGKIEVF